MQKIFKKSIILVFSVLALLNSFFSAHAKKITVEDIKRDLVLELKVPGAKVWEAGKDMKAEVVLVNRSKARTYPVIKFINPLDLTRSFKIHNLSLSLEIKDKEGNWIPAPVDNFELLSQCGMHIPSYKSEDFIMLKPGQEMREAFPKNYYIHFNLAQSVSLRLFAHYHFSASSINKDSVFLGKIPKEFKKAHSFELTSDPVELKFFRPIGISAQVKANPKVKQLNKFSDFLDIRLSNDSKEERVIFSGDTPQYNHRLRIQVSGSRVDPEVYAYAKDEKIIRRLKPGRGYSLLAPNEFFGGWEPDKTGEFKLRVVYDYESTDGFATTKSDWVTVKVVE